MKQIIPFLILLTSCASTVPKPTGRAGSDQYLVTNTIRDAVDQIAHRPLDSVKVEVVFPEGAVDVAWFGDHIETKLRALGLTPDPEAADSVTVEVMMLGSDQIESRIDIPLGIPDFDPSNDFTVTRLSIYRKTKQVARCRFRVVWEMDGKVWSENDEIGAEHYLIERELFGVSLGQTTDLKALRPEINDLWER